MCVVRTLYVGNLPWATRAEELQEVFGRHGEVISARVITDRETGRSRGFGFVEVADDDVENMIAAMNGTELDGRVITVNEAKAREERA
ncbi:RNA recognition motif domain-containing protein [Desulfotomaculum copahuensis]|uniref:RNA recognition motif domain-containing protein n=1 Tax=Desulfotomaculum copahuensis TaxID=1838280 RepID=UPI000A3F2B18